MVIASFPGREQPSRQQGFTLIELLVVIAIIAVLASLLLPVLSRGKSSSHSARCRSNLRQLAIALQLYVDDNGFYPPGFSLDSKGWMDRIIPFTNSPMGQFICPAPPFMFEGWSRPSLYGYNSMGTVNVFSKPDIQARRFGVGLGGYAMEGVGEVSVPDRAVKVPSDMIAFGDAFSGTREGKTSWGAFGNNWVGFVRPDEDQTCRQAAQKRHNGKLNVAFCDGHVEGIKVHSLLIDHSDAALRRWNNDNEPHRTYTLSVP